MKAANLRTIASSTSRRTAPGDLKLGSEPGLILTPPDKALVLCVDEKTMIQALDRTQPLLPMKPGQVARHTHDYVRNGTTDLFAALDVATGAVTHKFYERHRAIEFLDFLKLIARTYPRKEMHLVLDNSSTHETDEDETPTDF